MFFNYPKVILASLSSTRKKLLQNAGIVFSTCSFPLNEVEISTHYIKENKNLNSVSEILAIEKGKEVSHRNKDSLVISADQILILENKLWHKPSSMIEAKEHLLFFSGKTHVLTSSVVCFYEDNIVFKYTDTAKITMHSVSEEDIKKYLDEVGEDVLSSVGCYKIEGIGINLIKKIEGDYFTILGFPLIPLLNFLHKNKKVNN